ncbi:interleukin-13 receptor subunit alpha-2-like [Stegostoma tigrinum]|uniref:interleukin-13 receptor subunit alpha-2-like n=1 Tax=Stegostoma tigrinum TaxID=3053191 RepID=UPI00202B08E9|nr:interleukin-13 receptor subunit alpha-2-like [Stegostoma tigrinum]XP_048400323.1 interleukin-13 receptor subunit alpha-2-like [Stegostoma tigrinum]XP_048400324.1 interleukin-13 receptor subunit alpha-2-like [Stegostoma tigrinum]XP_048400325.1 interleukin-13 receptor subunit alpha-2-like [Stegostoma tigrinum]XP_048400327.1 interleukin-13 receptor subunit alpha-2-like [Stegostoma tigrinum]XP_048400328.1 interleukin-13 receptor subunit alpha-2-like [Stegostoma tigrinum]
MDLKNFAVFFALMLWQSDGSEMLTSVDPPTNLQVIDPGHLGPLHMHWQAPVSLADKKLCVRYMLSYCNVNSTNCKRVITKQLEYTDGFNFNEEIIVKVRTLVKEQCKSMMELQSDWVEKTYRPPMEGHAGSKVRDLQCIVYNLEYMECLWQNGMNALYGTDYTLYYWHEELEQTMQCNNYIKHQGRIVGCHFQSDDLIEFSDFNICINGSSELGPVRPAYFTLQLQDLVKAAAPDQVKLTLSTAETISIQWEPSASKLKPHCLKYEVQFRGKSSDWETKVISEGVTSTTLNATAGAIYCVRVRAAVNMFCADDSFWSDWSSLQCFTVRSEGGDNETIQLNNLTKLIVLIFLVSITLTLSLSTIYCWVRWKRLIAKKKLSALLNDNVKHIKKCINIDY